MSIFSRQTQIFLKKVGDSSNLVTAIVPKSDSCANPGDILIFRYSLGIGKGSRAERIFMVIEPITREARTGNLLLIGFKVPPNGQYTPDSLDSLYNKKELNPDDYRTYIMSKIYGPIRRIRRL